MKQFRSGFEGNKMINKLLTSKQINKLRKQANELQSHKFPVGVLGGACQLCGYRFGDEEKGCFPSKIINIDREILLKLLDMISLKGQEENPLVNYDETKRWFLNGKLHREDGPDGSEKWFVNGQELTKNTIKYPGGSKFLVFKRKEELKEPLMIEDKFRTKREELTEEEFEEQKKEKPIQCLKCKYLKDDVEYEREVGEEQFYRIKKLKKQIVTMREAVKEIENDRESLRIQLKEQKSMVEDSYGVKRWYLNGKIHREDGPAIEWAGGSKEWYINGEYHREDGPAIEYADETKKWYINGKLHREDGPACEYADGSKSWFINGKLHREDGPACEYVNGEKSWYLNGEKLAEEEFEENKTLFRPYKWWISGHVGSILRHGAWVVVCGDEEKADTALRAFRDGKMEKI